MMPFRAQALKIQLRSYQAEAVQQFLQAWCGIIQVPTGGGKTAILAGILSEVEGPWLVLVHRKVLRDQLVEQLQEYGISDVARYGGEHKDVGRVTISTWQSVARRYENRKPDVVRLVEESRAVCVDEIHVAPAPRFAELLEQMSPDCRLGLSATPLLRTDGRNGWALGYFGPVIYRVEAPQLAALGSISTPRVRFVLGPRITASGYANAIVRNHARNALVASLVVQAEKPVLILVNTVEHGLRLEAELRALKVKSRLLWAEHEPEYRRKSIKQLVSGAIDAIIASPIFDTGVDIPTLRSAVYAAGGRAPIACLQRLGRVMRPAPGKTECALWDVRDEGTPTVEESARLRAEAYSMTGFAVDFAGETVAAGTQPAAGLPDGGVPQNRPPPELVIMFLALSAVSLLYVLGLIIQCVGP